VKELETIARFMPYTFDCNQLEVIANSYDEIFYVGDVQYKKIEKVKYGDIGFRPRVYYRNDVEISEQSYENALEDHIPTLERNHLVFLENGKVCDFYFYHMKDGTLKNIIEIEFFSTAERENFIRPHWFGKEIKDESISDFALWNLIR
jgi:hypothetical protein